ncbi:MAG: M1 family metallopeptidase, partial [Candidatus Polarisedimenticolia bacterium]
VVHYDIDARLDPAARTVAGRETIAYRNFTRNSMRDMPFHLYPNAFSGTHSIYMRGTPWDDDVGLGQLRRMERDATWGHMRILSVEAEDGTDLTAATSIDDTVMTVPLPRPVPPGGSATLRIVWETLLPRTVHRMGVWGEHFDVMQWYPKPGVFTDAGWKMYPFHRRSEFFADFATFLVNLTVPARFRVEATGLPADVADLPDGTRRMTWRAEDVHDFAWVADPHAEVSRRVVAEGPYAGSPVEVIYIHPAYRTRSAPRVLEAARHGLLYYGERFLPYPYPRMVIDGLPMGLGGGMEYPMLFTVSMAWFLPRFYDAPEALTLHEFGHQYWYGILASNEFEEPWLDEGINSYVTQRALETLRPPRPGRTVTALGAYAATRVLHEGLALPLLRLRPDLDWLFGFAETPFRPTDRGLVGYPLSPYALDLPGLGEGSFLGAREGYAGVAQDDPLTAPSWGFHPGSYSGVVYDKTQVVLTTLERLLGRAVIDAALGEYARRFRFAHPTGEDFLGVLRETARRDRPDVDLEPLLGPLFHGTGTVDFAVTTLRSREARPPRGLLPPARAGEPPIDRRAA